jgi:hypothetical protein
VAESSDVVLTLEAKEAIRSFVWRLVVPSAVALAILSAIAGFVVKDWALTEANARVSTLVQTKIDSAEKAIDTSKDNFYTAQSALNTQTERLKYVAEDFKEKSAAISKVLIALQDIKAKFDDYTPVQISQLRDVLNKFAAGKDISSDIHPEKQPPASAQLKLETVQSDQVQFLLKALRTLAVNSDERPGIGEGTTSRCPAGTYAVGVDFRDQPGLAHGALWSGRIVCRSFPSFEEK